MTSKSSCKRTRSFIIITNRQMQIGMLWNFRKSDFYDDSMIEIPWAIIFFFPSVVIFSKWIHHLFDWVWCLGPRGPIFNALHGNLAVRVPLVWTRVLQLNLWVEQWFFNFILIFDGHYRAARLGLLQCERLSGLTEFEPPFRASCSSFLSNLEVFGRSSPIQKRISFSLW